MKPYLISVCLFLFLLSACGTVAGADPVAVTASPSSTSTAWVTYTPSPYPGAVATTPTVAPQPFTNPFLRVQKLPACTFPLAGTTIEESVPEHYTFSEPGLVLTSSSGSLEIVEWLPDSEQALIVETVTANGYEQYQSVQLFDPRMVKVKVYGQRDPSSTEQPLWLVDLQAVIYPETRVVSWSSDENGMYIPSSFVERQLLWLSHGDSDRAQNLREVEYHPAVTPHGRIIFSLAAKPDGNRLVSVEGDGAPLLQIYQSEIKDGSLGTEQQVPFDAPLPDNPNEPGPLNRLTRMAWQPGTSHVFFYNYVSSIDPTFLLDVDTGQACGLDFGGWVYAARWSPNGRYLAVRKSQGAMVPFTLDYDLVVLDTATGRLYQVNAKKLSPPDMMNIGVHRVIDFTWAPDNRHIAAIGSISFAGSSPPPSTERLFLVDFLSGQVSPLFPSYEFDSQCFHSDWGTGLAWSPDGSTLLTACPDIHLISVQKSDP